MENTYWFKQTAEKPLFEDVLWSKPENRARAGKLLIIGGNSHSFAAPAAAFGAAMSCGVGALRVLLPETLKKTVGVSFAEAEFIPSNLSGSLSVRALPELLENSAWADATLLAGDFGRNSETAILLEKFISKAKGKVSVAQDGLDYFLNSMSPLLTRPDTLMVINFGKLQKLAKNNRPQANLRYSMSLQQLAQGLNEWTTEQPINFIGNHEDFLLAASGGKVSTTTQKTETNWQVELAAYASVWWIQQSTKPFESLTTAVFEYLKKGE